MKRGWFIGLFVFLLYACGDGSSGDSIGGQNGTNVPTVRMFGDFHYVVLNGKTPYDRGYQHGTALRSQIEKGVRGWREWLKETSGLAADEVVQGVVAEAGGLAAAKKEAPDLVAEIQGIADGCGIDFNTLFAYGAFDETVQYLVRKIEGIDAGTIDGHCSCLGVFGRPNLPTIIGQNNDLPTFYDGTHTLLEIKAPGADHSILQFTWAGMLANNGMNSRGVGVTINFLPGDGDPKGLPMTMIQRRLLAMTSVDEAVAYLKTARCAAAMNFVVGDPKKAVSVEMTAAGTRVIEDTAGAPFVAHTNHELTGSPLPDDRNHGATRERLAVIVTALSTDGAAADLDAARKILATRPVCVEGKGGSERTMQSVLMELTADEPRLHMTAGPPCQDRYADYTTFRFR